MNLFTSLPFELQDYIFNIDGRYKTAMAKCFLRINQRRYTPTGNYASADWFPPEWFGLDSDSEVDSDSEGEGDYEDDVPEYYTEFQKRVAKYREVFHRTGQIPRITTDMRRLPKILKFKDAFGQYKLGMVHDTIMIDGRTYISSKKVLSVASDEPRRLSESSKYRRARGTETVVKCIDILNRDFNKKIRRRKNPTKLFRDLGVSENGIPGLLFNKVLVDTFGYDWKLGCGCNEPVPPASLAVVTGMLKRSKRDGILVRNACFTFNGKDYKICVKTGTGIIYRGETPVGYVDKHMSLRFMD